MNFGNCARSVGVDCLAFSSRNAFKVFGFARKMLSAQLVHSVKLRPRAEASDETKPFAGPILASRSSWISTAIRRRHACPDP